MRGKSSVRSQPDLDRILENFAKELVAMLYLPPPRSRPFFLERYEVSSLSSSEGDGSKQVGLESS